MTPRLKTLCFIMSLSHFLLDVVMVGLDVVTVPGLAGQVAVNSTAPSWACLHSLNLVKQVSFSPLTLFISVVAAVLQLRSDLGIIMIQAT